jgi:hypothetical protein
VLPVRAKQKHETLHALDVHHLSMHAIVCREHGAFLNALMHHTVQGMGDTWCLTMRSWQADLATPAANAGSNYSRFVGGDT